MKHSFFLNKINEEDIIDYKKIEGGVSSEVYKVRTSKKSYCVKRSLAKLLVKKDWFVDTKRLKFEYFWLKHCKKIIPNSIPKIIKYDHKKKILIIEFFNDTKYFTLKSLLLSKKINIKLINKISRSLFKIHKKSRGSKIKNKYKGNDKNFFDLRLDAYFNEVKRVHPKLIKKVNKIILDYRKNSSTLIHGDFSPKNILTNNKVIKFIDAETCNYGDPVFDLVFFTNHLLIKSIFIPSKKKLFLESYKNFFDTYIKLLDWENRKNFCQRCINMIPIMLIARVDGKSPVEYIKDKSTKNNIRKLSFRLIEENIESMEKLYTLLK